MVYISGGTGLLTPRDIFDHIDMRQGMRVADLGCGTTGSFTIEAARVVGEGGVVYAVDVLKSVLEEVAKKARLERVENVKTVWSNLEIVGATKITDESIDIAMLVNILFQSKEYESIFKETWRLVKKGGKLLVIDWKQTQVPFGPPVVDRLKPDYVKRIAEDVGFQAFEEFSAGNFHYGFIFLK